MMSGVRLLNSMGASGIPFTGMDVGGFTGNPSQNLFGRWVSIGAFSPFFRIHAAIDTKEADPWSFGERIESINKSYISLRYKLLPYLYSTFYESSQNGMPVNRTPALYYPQNDKVFSGWYHNQYFFGQNLLVCPSESNKEFTRVYLPETCGWYSLYNDSYNKGNEELVVESPIEKLPVYVKGGAIIPMQKLVMSTQYNPGDTLFIHAYNGTKGSSFVYYEDDGKTYNNTNGDFHSRTLVNDPAKRQLVFEAPQGKAASKFKTVKVILHGWNSATLKGNWKSENISFVDPLPNFDPIGSGVPAPACAVKTATFSLQSSKFSVAW
jgi:alpha-glucosidase